MTGRREKQKDARRRRILSAATHLFTKHGYSPTSIGDIARRARLATGTLYNYFPSKAEIAMAAGVTDRVWNFDDLFDAVMAA